jgi:hypothetical protein
MNNTISTREKQLAIIGSLLDPSLVTISDRAIDTLEADFSNFAVASARLPFTPASPRDAIPCILAQTALQYRFWDGFGADYRRYAIGDKVGSTAMVAGFDRAWGSESTPGAGILECAMAGVARSFSMAPDTLAPYFGDIPDPQSRVQILHEVLCSKQLERVTDELDRAFRAGHAGVDEARLIAIAFPRAYADLFLKKAMLAVGLMVAEYRRAGVQCQESLMAYADYQVPAVMRHFGILEYSPELAAKVDGRQHLLKNGREELAIRAATIIGCEMFAWRHKVTAAETDWLFWLQRKATKQPFHLTDTTDY